MFKLLVVDDEEFVKNGIVNLSLWQKLGFNSIITSSNGIEALEKINQIKPHVVLTDIRMPYMDGLELTRKIKRQYPEIMTVILSAYDEFEYARQAIDNGVKGYLLKPLKEIEVIEIFTRIRDELINNKGQSINNENNLVVRQEMFLKEIIKGITPKEGNLIHELGSIGVNLNCKFNRIAVFSFDILYLTQGRQDEFQYIINIAREYLMKKGIPATLYMGYLVAVLNSDTSISKIDAIISIKQYIKYIENVVEEEYNKQIYMTIGVGNLCNNILNIPQSYGQALYAISRQYSSENYSIVFYQDLNVFDKSTSTEGGSFLESQNIENIIDLIIDNIFNNNIEELTKNTYSLFDLLEQDNIHLIEDVKLKLMEIIFRIALKLKEKGINEGNFNKLRILKTIQSFNRFADLKIWFKDELKQFAKDIQANAVNASEYSVWYIDEAKLYVKKEYDKKITLDVISKYLHINPVYFSISFKRKTGQNFIDYVKHVKIEKAKELLTKPKHKVKEIAVMVGYDDYSYFCKVFKKIVDVSPVEYRISTHT